MADSSAGSPPSGDALGPVVVRIRCGADLAELAADALWQAGATAVAEEPACTYRGIAAHTGTPGSAVPAGDTATVGPAGAGPDVVAATVELTGEVPHDAFAGLRSWCRNAPGDAEVEVLEVDPAWADAWSEHARAVRVGPLVVRPVWVDEPVEPDEIDLPLDPGPTFGSGSHPSTRGVLREMVGLIGGGERVLDVGSGSGVLSAAALILGAAAAVAVDIDPAAAQAGRAAAALCGVHDRFEFHHGGPDAVDGTFDMVVANMLIGAIESLGGDIRERCGSPATMILGGFLESQRDRALAAVQPAEVLSDAVEDGWVTLVVAAR